MAKLSKSEVKAPSKSEVKAAISKILARNERRPFIHPRPLPRSNLARLASAFAEAGIDVKKLEKIASEERKEFAQQNAALEKQYKANLANKKLALRALQGQTVGVQTDTVSTAVAIYEENRHRKIIIDKRLEAWNNWVRFYHVDESDELDGTGNAPLLVGVAFFFHWHNPTNGRLVIRANAELGLRGSCAVNVYPHEFLGGSASLSVRAQLRAYLGNLQRPVWGPPNDFLSLYAHVGVPGIIYNQTSDSRELDTAAYVTLDHLLVERRESVIFSVNVQFWYSLEYGDVDIAFFADPGTLFANRKLICPALEIEWGGEPTVMGPGVMN